ncbi:MAG: substrate-binding domain-containing protein [Armatimonadota bacterium]|nr:substrate-binding domain-containing protein [Armatimonadota bacterium]
MRGAGVLRAVLGGLLLGVLVGAAGMPAPAQADLAGAARREGRVVVYGSMETDVFEVIRKIYEGRYGVQVDYWRAASNRVMDRVLTETRAGRPLFDVVLTNRSPMLILKRAGAFARFAAPSYEAFPAPTHDRDGILSPSYRVVVVSALFNTRLLRPEDAPRTLPDLLDPKWKGRLVMPDPTQHTTTAVWLANLQKILGAQHRSFIERLAGQVGLVESFIPAVQKVIAGEYPVGISYVKYVHVFGQDGAPLDYARLNPVLAEAHHVALGARAAHPNAGKLLIDTLTSRAGLLALARAGEFVLVPGVYPPIKDAEKLRVVPMDDLDEDELKQFREEFGRLFVRR